MIPEISDREFDYIIGQFRIPILVEFWKPGCSHCQALLQELEDLQEETRNRLTIFKMNVEENRVIPADLEIRSLPALALFVKGEFQQFIGGMGRNAEIRTQLSRWLGPNEPRR